MRAVSETLAAKLAVGVTTLCFVWRVERRDGERFAFTDHDGPLPFDDLMAEPINGIASGVIEKSIGLNADSASIAGALASDAITEDELAHGMWDGARVDIYRVDWSLPLDRVHLFAGHIGEVRRGAQAFEAELRGLQAKLNVPVGRVFSRFCDADLGDVRCGVDLGAPEFRVVGIVSEIIGTHAFKASGLGGYAEQWFARGRVEWEGGAAEIASHRVEGEDAIFELLDPAPLAVDQEFEAFAGCDKRIDTCRAKFTNVINFRGFPHMPGNDALQSGPSPAEPLHGGSRLR